MSDTYIPAALRRLVMERAGYCCEYCLVQSHYSPDPLAVDHVTPVSLGGLTLAPNLASACFGCNQHKSNRVTAIDPETKALAPLFHPRLQIWGEHFKWSEDFTRMIGMTPTGRATVAALKLNRLGLINMRRVFHTFGIHPPGGRA